MTFDQIDKTAQRGFVAGTITLKERLAEAAGKLIAHEDDKPQTDEHKQRLAPGTILENHIDKQREKWKPRSGACDENKELIEPHIVASIQK